jgi:4-hydroxybenzoate polyprenyltransferase
MTQEPTQTLTPKPTLKQRLDAYEKLMRLDKPIGTLLLLWPALWGLWFASPVYQRVEIVLIFVLGTVLMRSAGCVMNDYADRDIDAHVKRTAGRPLAKKLIDPKEALALAAVLALLAFALVLFLNKLTILLSLVALFLAVTYPFTKRFFPLPQAYLGIAFGFSIPMAFAAHQNSVPALAWVLLLANVFWAIAYDTEYAMVDRDDDMKLNLKSSALLFGVFDVALTMVFHGLFLAVMAGVGLYLKQGLFYFLGLALAAALIACQYRMIRRRDRDGCFRAFMNNNWVGAAVFAGLALDYYFMIPVIK